MENRALSILFDVKTHDEKEQRVITGIATSPTPDRNGDVVEPRGVVSAPNLPLLLNHDHAQLVGRASLGRATARGIPFTGKLPKVSEPGALKDRVDSVWQALKYKLLTGVSIGFRVLDGVPMQSGGTRFRAVEVLELSLVPVPAQPDAVIDAVRSGSVAAREAVIRSIPRPRSAATYEYDRAAYERMVRQQYMDDPQLRALRDRRMGRPDATAAGLFGLD